jgi:hypothetical protein
LGRGGEWYTINMDLQEKKGVSPISKQAAYSKAAAYFEEALETAIDVMRKSKNDNARLGAARTVISKVLPDLKSEDMNVIGDIKGKWVVELRKYGNNTNDKDSSNLST